MTLDLTRGVTRAQLAETIFNSSFGDCHSPEQSYKMSETRQMVVTVLIYSLISLLGIAFLTFAIVGSSAALPSFKATVDLVFGGAVVGIFGLFGLGITAGVVFAVVYHYLLKLSQDEAIKWLKNMKVSLETYNQKMNPSDKTQEALVTKPEDRTLWNAYYDASMTKIEGLLSNYPAQINN